jgi:hypothetical protein
MNVSLIYYRHSKIFGRFPIVFHMLIYSYLLLHDTLQAQLHSLLMVCHGKEFYDPGHPDKYLWLILLGEGSWSREEHNGTYKQLEISVFLGHYCKHCYSDGRGQSKGFLLVIKV